MPQPVGRRLTLSLPRRFVTDLVCTAKQMPLVSIRRTINVAPVVAARRRARPRPGWCAILTKAYAFVAARHPELRRAYIPFPRPHLYEHPLNVASVSLERRFGGEDAVFFAHLRCPETQALAAIDRHLIRCKEAPVEQFGLYRRILTLSRLPRPLRCLAWWVGLNTSGRRRVRNLGTFGVTSVSNLGAISGTVLSPLTTTLNYGVIADDGTLEVMLTFDHRVMDGGITARALEEMEGVLGSEILNELRYLEAVDPERDGRACA